ncbi:MAG: DUF998 domain-containing protein [Patescibacteria group bacterium]
MKSRIDRILLICGVLGTPIFLFSTVLVRLIYPYPYISQTISSLGALDSPAKTLANIFIFNLFGILIALFALGIFRSPEMRMAGKIASVFFLLAGISMFLVGIFPGSTVQVDEPTPGDSIHNKFAFYPFPLMAIGFILFALGVITHRRLWWLIFPIVLVGPAALIIRHLTTQFPFVYYIGVLQLLAIGLPFLVLTVLAMALYRAEGNKGTVLFIIAIAITTVSIFGLAKGIDNTSERTGIPYLCSDEKDCIDFCQNRKGGCEKACDKYPENPVCQKIFK